MGQAPVRGLVREPGSESAQVLALALARELALALVREPAWA
ncbi:MAG: hypothetical protein V1771_02680 [Chloroflexota bacterium]